MKRAKWAFILVIAAACEGVLTEADVTDREPGDATGTAHTGEWWLESLTMSCDGDCEGRIDEFTFSVCDVGDRTSMVADVEQDDGALSFDVDNSDYVSRLDGGAWRDATFVVGGKRTQQGGEITILTLAEGTFAGDELTGTAKLRIEGAGTSCNVEVELSGER